MLAKHIIKKYGYQWDDSWEDTDDILSVMNTMKSLDENLVNVAQDCVNYLRPKKYDEKNLIYILRQYGITEEQAKEWYGIPYDND